MQVGTNKSNLCCGLSSLKFNIRKWIKKQFYIRCMMKKYPEYPDKRCFNCGALYAGICFPILGSCEDPTIDAKYCEE